jgi:hypothetical protein
MNNMGRSIISGITIKWTIGVVCLAIMPQLVAQKKQKDFGVPLAPPDPLEEFAVAINFGYGQGPKESDDPVIFEKLLVNIKKAGYNTIYCVYRDWRLELCRKHKVKMMIDILAHHEGAKTDVRRTEQRETVRKICEKVRDDKAVWGYNLWNERLDKFAPGGIDAMHENLALIRKWDPSHPVWVGTYLGYFLDRVQGTAGILAYYDYHWSRGLGLHYNTITHCHKLCQNRADFFGRWILVNPDPRKSLYTINTSIAHGMKVMIWFIKGAVDPKTGELNVNHEHLKVHKEIRMLYKEIAELGKPMAVYSTPMTRTMDDKERAKDVPRPLTAFPDDHWATVTSGEAFVGVFKYDTGEDALYIANHNALRAQNMVISLNPAQEKDVHVEMFNRAKGGWIDMKPKGNSVSFDLGAGLGELLRITGVKSL